MAHEDTLNKLSLTEKRYELSQLHLGRRAKIYLKRSEQHLMIGFVCFLLSAGAFVVSAVAALLLIILAALFCRSAFKLLDKEYCLENLKAFEKMICHIDDHESLDNIKAWMHTLKPKRYTFHPDDIPAELYTKVDYEADDFYTRVFT